MTRGQTSMADLEKKVDDQYGATSARIDQLSNHIEQLGNQFAQSMDELRILVQSQANGQPRTTSGAIPETIPE